MHRTPESEPHDRNSEREPGTGSEDHAATRPLPPRTEHDSGTAETRAVPTQGSPSTPQPYGGSPQASPDQNNAYPRYAPPQYGTPQHTPSGDAAAAYPAGTAQKATHQGTTHPGAAPHGSPQYGAPQYGAPPAGQYREQSASETPVLVGGGGQPPVTDGSGPTGPSGPGASGSGKKSRSGTLLAGLAIGALLGGVVGGGVGAVVSANLSQTSVAAGGNGGTLTLQNTDTATQVSGVAAAATPSVVTLEVQSSNAQGSGSGIVYSEDGYIVTNAHVATLDGAAIDGADIKVKFSDGRILQGELVGTDPYADLAVVKVDAEGLSPATFADSDQINVGDLTVAIGAPLNLSNTVTSGVVSALNRGISVGSPLIPDNTEQPDQSQPEEGNGFPWDFRFGTPDEEGQQQPEQQQASGSVTLPVVQTDASINPGNSGGALLNGEGEVIGVNVAIASNAGSEAAGSDGLGFAIPSNLANRIAQEIIDGDQPSHGQLGISVADSSTDTDADASVAGGLVASVEQGGPAAEAGLKQGDVITAVDGIPAIDGTSVSALVRYHEGGSDVKISYTRDGKASETTATLGTLEW
ncbi:trypsin-like peptidase domain-containing protein [Leucobacter tardus]|uniref:Trypsin-like peptidase domain-containing protein n=1 Tax=Leucobacter tardus TaxID=501483 RepID=A0A939QKM1_9MICO|nr:trypsin-like peptidase domain-containing protein [Leucobacter tardus]